MAVQQGPIAFPRPTRVVLRILIANAALWLVFAVGINLAQIRPLSEAYDLLTLTPTEVAPGLRLWEVVSYAWLHDLGGLSHILFNSMALFFLGPALERRWGGRGFLKFYLLSGIIAGLFSVLVGFLFGGRWDAPIVGASGAIFGLVTAYSLLIPHAQFLLFFVLPVQAKWLVWISLGLDLLFFIANPQGNVAIQTHLGGALAGWLLITQNWNPRIFLPRLKRLFGGGPRRGPPGPGGRAPLYAVPGGKKDRNLLN
jgi:membrane associated rhomboid family serine protease